MKYNTIKCACAGNGYSSDVSDTPQHRKEKEAHQEMKKAHQQMKEALGKEKEAHQQTQHLKHELEEELEKLKSSEFSVGNTSSRCIITTWVDTRYLGNLYWVGLSWICIIDTYCVKELENSSHLVFGDLH